MKMAATHPKPAQPALIEERIYRHALPVRAFHWINATCIIVLLMSGLQIFGAYPRLHWGNVGYDGMPAVFEITGAGSMEDPTSWVQIGSHRIYTTGFLGVPAQTSAGLMNWAFPGWMTIPQGVLALGYARGWHFLVAWILSFNLGWYWAYAYFSGRLKKELLPTREQCHVILICHDVWGHICLKRHSGPNARHYNFLQRLAYLSVLVVLLPNQILSGMTMSNTAVAIFPWLIELYGGRQSARTLHFIGAMLLLAFLFIHIFQIFVAGFKNEMRSIITGYFVVNRERNE